MPSITTSSAPGIAAAVARPPLTSITRSSVPWITSVGTVSERSREVRSPDASTATACLARALHDLLAVGRRRPGEHPHRLGVRPTDRDIAGAGHHRRQGPDAVRML